MVRTIVVGDMHGCLDEFRELMHLVGYQPGKSRLVLVGDLIDRGPHPRGCVQEAMRLGALCVKSNHEQKMIEWLEKEARMNTGGPKNGMDPPFPGRRAEWTSFSLDEILWLERCPLWIDLGGDWLVVHAGFEPKPLSEQIAGNVTRVRWVHETTGNFVGMKKVPVPGSEDPAKPHVSGTRPLTPEAIALREKRQAERLAKGLPAVAEQKRRPKKYTTSFEQPEHSKAWQDMWPGPQNVIYGHSAQRGNPLVESRIHDSCSSSSREVFTIGIDTGCVFGYKLTALILEGDKAPEFVQVQAAKEYYPWPD